MAIIGSGTFRLDPPRLRVNEEEERDRHSTWFELYFDLVFVAAVAQLAAALAHNPSAAVFGRFAGLFAVVAWAWAGYNLYANRFDTDDVVFRLAKAAAMLGIAAVAINVHRVMAGSGGTVGFAVAYVFERVILIGLYVRARRSIGGPAHALIDIYLRWFSFTTVIWLASIAAPSPYREVMWAVAILIDLTAPIRAWQRAGSALILASHVTERFGTFFIIVLGESVVAVVAGVAGLEFNIQAWVVAVSCFVIALCLWWIYFDLADTSVLGRGRLGLVYIYGHIPLLAGVTAFGAGTKLAITHVAHSGLEPGARWALAGGIATFILSLAAFHLGAEWTRPRDRTFVSRLVLAAGAIALAAFGDVLPPVAFVLLLGAGVFGQLMIEAFTFPVGAASVLQTQLAPAEAPKLAGGEA